MTIISESGSLEGYEPDDLIPEGSRPSFQYTAPIWENRMPGNAPNPFQGTSLSVVFETNDDRHPGSSFGFITVGRDGPSEERPLAHYYTGYGIAVRPSTDPNVHNVFVVDSSLAVPEPVLENVIHTGWGDLAYLASCHVDISPGESYNVRLDIGEGNTLKAFIWSTSSGTIPGVPQMVYGSYSPVAQGRYFGVSTSVTDGFTWKWDNIYLSYTDDRYAVKYFNFDGKNIINDFSVKAYAYGYGYDGGPLPEYGILMFIWNYSTESWDLVDSHEAGPGGDTTNILLTGHGLSVGEYVGSPASSLVASSELDRVKIILVSKYPSSLASSVDSGVEVDYIKLENWDTESAHVGGMGDIYIRDSSQPVSHSIDINNVTETEWLLSSNTNILGDLLLPILWIRSVELLDGMGNPTGYFAEELTDYQLIVHAPYSRYSTKEQNYIIFRNIIGSDVRVTYWTYGAMESIQAFIDAELQRNVTDDYLAKVYTPAELFLDLSVDGSMSPIDLFTLLSLWVNGSSDRTMSHDKVRAFLESQNKINRVLVNKIRAAIHLPDGTTEYVEDDIELDERHGFILIPNASHITISAV